MATAPTAAMMRERVACTEPELASALDAPGARRSHHERDGLERGGEESSEPMGRWPRSRSWTCASAGPASSTRVSISLHRFSRESGSLIGQTVAECLAKLGDFRCRSRPAERRISEQGRPGSSRQNQTANSQPSTYASAVQTKTGRMALKPTPAVRRHLDDSPLDDLCPPARRS